MATILATNGSRPGAFWQRVWHLLAANGSGLRGNWPPDGDIWQVLARRLPVRPPAGVQARGLRVEAQFDDARADILARGQAAGVPAIWRIAGPLIGFLEQHAIGPVSGETLVAKICKLRQ
ncbi:MAG TPA: hypothetical protein VII73_08250 [Caulobacteraceae bacterium]